MGFTAYPQYGDYDKTLAASIITNVSYFINDGVKIIIKIYGFLLLKMNLIILFYFPFYGALMSVARILMDSLSHVRFLCQKYCSHHLCNCFKTLYTARIAFLRVLAPPLDGLDPFSYTLKSTNGSDQNNIKKH